MSQTPPTPWIHIGECPVCVDGLCRVRACRDHQGQLHLYAMCDECEAMWLEPNTDSKKVFPSQDSPSCPICGQALFGDQARWARPEDIAQRADWSLAAIFEIAGSDDDTSADDLLSVEDLTTDLDAPALQAPKMDSEVSCGACSAGLETEPSKSNSSADASDSSYGQDEPKPGC